MSQAKANLQIDYIEWPATDLVATRAFYEAVFGWTFTDYGPGYTSFSDGRISGGFYRVEEPRALAALVVIYAVDLEGCLEKVKAAGGKIVQDIFSFPGGRRFHFADPGGNELAVWSE